MQKELSKLRSHPAWPVLAGEVLRRQESWAANLAKRLIGGDLVDQREIDRRSSFFTGAAWVVGMVDGSDGEIERLLVRATKERS